MTAMVVVVVVLLVCLAFVVVVVGSIAALVFFLVRHAAGSGDRLRAILAGWAENRGYELVEVGDASGRDHPFKDRFGFGFGKRPAVVRHIEVRDERGRERQGWVYLPMRMVGRSFAGYLTNELEVAWAD